MDGWPSVEFPPLGKRPPARPSVSPPMHRVKSLAALPRMESESWAAALPLSARGTTKWGAVPVLPAYLSVPLPPLFVVVVFVSGGRDERRDIHT